MAICDRHRIVMDEWAAGIGNLDALDLDHCRTCPDCRAALEEAQTLKECLESWAAAVETEARDAAQLPVPARPRRRSQLRRATPWLAAAAATALLWWMAPYTVVQRYLSAPASPLVLPDYLAALQTEAAREDLVTFLSRSELFLLGVLDQHRCHPEDSTAAQAAADRLIRQKRQLETRLTGDRFSDVRPFLDELEVLLLVVAEGGGCLGDGEVAHWRQVIQSRATLLRINLLQMEDRL